MYNYDVAAGGKSVLPEETRSFLEVIPVAQPNVDCCQCSLIFSVDDCLLERHLLPQSDEDFSQVDKSLAQSGCQLHAFLLNVI